MKGGLRKTALILATLLSNQCSVAQTKGITEGWSVTRHTTHNGLPQNSVRSIAADTTGYLWITTEGGLTRYDGQRFTNLAMRDNNVAETTRLRNLMHTRSGELIIDDVRGHVYTLEQPERKVRIMAHSNLATFQGMPPSSAHHLWLLRNWTRFWPDKNLIPEVTVLTSTAHVWAVHANDTLMLLTDSTIRTVIHLPPYTSRPFFLGGVIHMLRPGAPALRLDPESSTLVEVPISPVPEQGDIAPAVHVQPLQGSVFLVTPGMVHRILLEPDGTGLRTERAVDGLPLDTRVRSVVELKEHGMLAVGTSNKGLYVYRKQPITVLACPSESNSFYAQVAMPDGRVMAINDVYKPLMLGAEGCGPAPTELPLIKGEGLLVDRHGMIWYSDFTHIKRWDPSTGISTEVRILPANSGVVYLEEGDSVWIATSSELGYIRDDKYRKVYDFPYIVRRESVFMLHRDVHERFWYASCDGLFRSTDASCTSFEPFPDLQGKCVRAISEIDGILFIGTYGHGAFLITGDRAVPIPLDRNRALTHVHVFHKDENNVVWMTTDRGLIRARLDDLQLLLKDPEHIPYYGHYGELAGLRSTEFNGGTSPAYVELANGVLSFPNMEGLIQFDPRKMPALFPKGNVTFSSILVDGAVWKQRGGLVLEAGTGELVVEVSLPYWGDPINAQLEYRIAGLHTAWVPLADDDHRIRITRPSWGNYELMVRKVGGGLRGDTGSASLGFAVRAPWFVRGPAILCYVVVLLLAFHLFSRWNAARLRRANVLLEDRVQQRTQALDATNAELQRSVQLRERLLFIVSHDIATPIRFISRVAGSAMRMLPEESGGSVLSETLRDLSISSGKLHANATNLLRWARHQQGGLTATRGHVALHPFVEEQVALVTEMAAIKGIELVNMIDVEDIVHTDRDILGIVMNNLLTNAIGHNAAPCQVVVSGAVTDKGYVLSVADTGSGMPVPRLELLRRTLAGGTPPPPSDGSDAGGSGLGFRITSELSLLLSIQVELDSDARGTTVRLFLPNGREEGITSIKA